MMKNIEFNKRVVAAKGSPIRTFNDRISHIDGLLKFTLGEPDFNAPEIAKKAAIEAIEANQSGYTHSRGLIELRQAITRYLKRHYALDYSAEEELLVSVGATGALYSTITALLNPGDQVVVPSPYYVIYKTQVELAGAEFVPVDISDTGFVLTPETLEATLENYPKTKVLILNTPSNPTGVTYSRDQLEAIADVARAHDLIVVSDEIYAELTYEEDHVSMAELLPEQTILINGASKSHAMTGWRMGFVAAPKVFIDQIFKVQQAAINTPTTPIQYGSIAAYDEADGAIEDMRAAYRQRRDLVLDGLTDLGFEAAHPDGAFYLFVKVPSWFKGDDTDFCLALAEEVKVGLIPGSSFGEAGNNYFRISYAASTESLQELIKRLAEFKAARA